MKSFKETFIIWKLAILRLFFYCFVVGANSYLSAMNGQKWSELSGEYRFDLILGILVAMILVIISFLDSTVKNLASGDVLPPGVESIAQTSNVTKDSQVETLTVKTTPATEPIVVDPKS